VKEPAYSLNALHVERRDIGKRALVWIKWITGNNKMVTKLGIIPFKETASLDFLNTVL